VPYLAQLAAMLSFCQLLKRNVWGVN